MPLLRSLGKSRCARKNNIRGAVYRHGAPTELGTAKRGLWVVLSTHGAPNGAWEAAGKEEYNWRPCSTDMSLLRSSGGEKGFWVVRFYRHATPTELGNGRKKKNIIG